MNPDGLIALAQSNPTDPRIDEALAQLVARKDAAGLDELFRRALAPIRSVDTIADMFESYRTVNFCRKVSGALALVPGDDAVRRLLTHTTWDQDDAHQLGARLAFAQSLETLNLALGIGGNRSLFQTWVLESVMRRSHHAASAEVQEFWSGMTSLKDLSERPTVPLMLESVELGLRALMPRYEVSSATDAPLFPLPTGRALPAPNVRRCLQPTDIAPCSTENMGSLTGLREIEALRSARGGIALITSSFASISEADLEVFGISPPPKNGRFIQGVDLVSFIFSRAAPRNFRTASGVRAILRTVLCEMGGTERLDVLFARREALVFDDDRYDLAFACESADRTKLLWCFLAPPK